VQGKKVLYGGIRGDNAGLGIGLSDSVLNRNKTGPVEGDLLLKRDITESQNHRITE